MSTVPEKALNPFGSVAVVASPTGGGASAAALASREAQDIMMQMMCARQFPRDPIRATDRALNAFTRPELCEEAMYAYSRGGSDVSGLSIRAAEVLAQCWGNIRTGVAELVRGAGQSELLSFAQDLETGFSDEKRFFVQHWRDTKQGGKAVTGERDVYELGANMGARRKRACILAVIPKDVQAACERQIEITLKQKAEVTPDSIKALLQAFEKYGVTKEQIEKRIQRHIDAMLPAQLVQMRRIFASLKDGMSSAEEWFEMGAAPAPEQASTSQTEAAKQALKGKQPKTQASKDEGNIPHFDDATAEAELKKHQTSAAHDKAWNEILKDYEATNRKLPDGLEPLYKDRLEALKEKESKKDL
jgi:hypothetical protein